MKSNFTTLTRWCLWLTLLLSGCESEKISACPDANCNDYRTHQQAQSAFDADPECLDRLDDDNDGIACEHLINTGGSGGSGGSGSGSGGSGCPTTANCGCSGIPKAQCGGACCQWIVGTGCRCR